MTKPKNPYESENTRWSYNNGLRDGEKRLARALRRWIWKRNRTDGLDVYGWLSARQKKERKK